MFWRKAGAVANKGMFWISGSCSCEICVSFRHAYFGDGDFVYRSVREQMVNVVTTLPPPDRQSAAQICNEDANDGVNGYVSCNATMTSVMSSEHDLMPK